MCTTNGRCINKVDLCDGIEDCLDGEDETLGCELRVSTVVWDEQTQVLFNFNRLYFKGETLYRVVQHIKLKLRLVEYYKSTKSVLPLAHFQQS